MMIETLDQVEQRTKEALEKQKDNLEYLQTFLLSFNNFFLGMQGKLNDFRKKNYKMDSKEAEVFLKNLFDKIESLHRGLNLVAKKITEPEITLHKEAQNRGDWLFDFGTNVENLNQSLEKAVQHYKHSEEVRKALINDSRKIKSHSDELLKLTAEKIEHDEKLLSQTGKIFRNWAGNNPLRLTHRPSLRDLSNIENILKKERDILHRIELGTEADFINRHFFSIVSLADVLKKMDSLEKLKELSPEQRQDLLKLLEHNFKKIELWHQFLEEFKSVPNFSNLDITKVKESLSFMAVRLRSAFKNLSNNLSSKAFYEVKDALKEALGLSKKLNGDIRKYERYLQDELKELHFTLQMMKEL